ncbi:hypothetical protein HYDPIDRAFT_90566 [Hydnomerulius pinastri MD-312]|uniref:CsbD-like domain-containing protein n=1 Tax=Hydnomerulius pinastri MD-312 TaxID=994086 RepID=A0A0C9WEX9_9AGAM|nr:hypothetical protein HYDPIDRAFT_90566 [Hydnomerulius pinastri MD-312]
MSDNYHTPTHQLHDSSQPLPGSNTRGAAQTQDYSPEHMERLPSSTIHGADPTGVTKERTGGAGGQQGSQGKTAFNSERPLGVAPAPEGGVAIGGQGNLPESQAGLGDKLVGKTQKVIGKYTNKPELHEKGELRETGGKAATEGRARATHD